MSHKIVVGGVASSVEHMKRVTDRLSDHYDEDFEGVTLRQGFEDPVELERRLRGNTVFTHSTGFEAIRHTSPEEIVGFAPPLRSRVPKLLGRATLSNLELLGRFVRHPDGEVAADMLATAKEFLSYRREFFQLSRIAASHAFDIAADARRAGIPTSIAFMKYDRLFQSDPVEVTQARSIGVRVLILPGSHEDFMFWPVSVMQQYDQAVQDLETNDTFGDRWN